MDSKNLFCCILIMLGLFLPKAHASDYAVFHESWSDGVGDQKKSGALVELLDLSSLAANQKIEVHEHWEQEVSIPWFFESLPLQFVGTVRSVEVWDGVSVAWIDYTIQKSFMRQLIPLHEDETLWNERLSKQNLEGADFKGEGSFLVRLADRKILAHQFLLDGVFQSDAGKRTGQLEWASVHMERNEL